MVRTDNLRAQSTQFVMGGEAVKVVVALPTGEMEQDLRLLLLHFAFSLPFAAALAITIGYLLARRALAPVSAMTERAKAITAEKLSERLPVQNPNDELGQLATVFNAAFSRLEQSFEQLRHFTADASHELRTPLTAIRSVGEVGLRGPRDAAAYREIIGSMLEETERLACLVESLLHLSRGDAGELKLNLESADLAGLAREVAGQMEILANEKGQRLAVDAPDAVWADVDRELLRQALLNLIDNAIKYGAPNTAVRGGSGARHRRSVGSARQRRGHCQRTPRACLRPLLSRR